VVQPLEETAAAIRCRFFEYFIKLGKGASGAGVNTLNAGNKATHHGNILTDITLVNRGHITDIPTFNLLYGIYPKDTTPFLSMFPSPTDIMIVYE